MAAGPQHTTVLILSQSSAESHTSDHAHCSSASLNTVIGTNGRQVRARACCCVKNRYIKVQINKETDDKFPNLAYKKISSH